MKRFDFSSLSGPLLLAWVLLCIIVILGLGTFYIVYLSGRSQASQAALPTVLVLPNTPTPALGVSIPASPTAQPPPPTATPVPPTLAPTASETLYQVQQGDYLGSIAAQFGVSIESIIAANNLESDIILPGQNLLIPLPGSPDATPTPNTASGERVHTVLAYESLERIASWYNLPIEDIRTANAMIGDAVFPGQTLIIPTNTPLEPTPWAFSQFEPAAYPVSYAADRFTLHYTSGSYAAYNTAILAALEQTALDHIERLYDAPLNGSFDVYLAGSLFAPPNRGLRGRSISAQWTNYLLFDGTGNPAEQQYMAAHELTHLYAWQVFGIPISVMLSEGAAVYAGSELVAGSGRLPPPLFCAAHLQMDALPQVTGSLAYEGHNYDLVNYYAAGCFVGYLVETYGPEKFALLYPTNNYESIYGKSDRVLEADWRLHLGSLQVTGVDPDQLVAVTKQVTTAYREFMPAFDGSPAHIEAYRLLDQARIAMLENRLGDASLKLEAYRAARSENQ